MKTMKMLALPIIVLYAATVFGQTMESKNDVYERKHSAALKAAGAGGVATYIGSVSALEATDDLERLHSTSRFYGAKEMIDELRSSFIEPSDEIKKLATAQYNGRPYKQVMIEITPLGEVKKRNLVTYGFEPVSKGEKELYSFFTKRVAADIAKKEAELLKRRTNGRLVGAGALAGTVYLIHKANEFDRLADTEDAPPMITHGQAASAK